MDKAIENKIINLFEQALCDETLIESANADQQRIADDMYVGRLTELVQLHREISEQIEKSCSDINEKYQELETNAKKVFAHGKNVLSAMHESGKEMEEFLIENSNSKIYHSLIDDMKNIHEKMMDLSALEMQKFDCVESAKATILMIPKEREEVGDQLIEMENNEEEHKTDGLYRIDCVHVYLTKTFADLQENNQLLHLWQHIRDLDETSKSFLNLHNSMTNYLVEEYQSMKTMVDYMIKRDEMQFNTLKSTFVSQQLENLDLKKLYSVVDCETMDYEDELEEEFEIVD